MGFDNNTVKRNNGDAKSHRRYFLPRENIKDYNILIDGRNIYDQNISGKITRYNELIRLATGKSEDYTAGSLIDCNYYYEDWNIVALDLCRQAILDSDPSSI